jgi:FkbM family methyltransferase
MSNADTAAFGAFAPCRFDRAVLALTTRLPDNWLGLRLAIALRRTVSMRLPYPDGALDVLRWGMRLRLHPRDNGCEKNLLFTPLMYEPVELQELAADIAAARGQGRPFAFVDIGANVGLFSFFVASRAGPAARILAIEPEPGNLSRLTFNVCANPGAPIEIIPVALSEEAGDLAVTLDRRDRGGSRTRKIGCQAIAPGEVQVPSQTLLAVIERRGLVAIDALKIDVEGAEDAVLCPFFRDAPAQLWPRLIVIEDSRGSWKHDLMSALFARGYELVTRSRQNLVLRRINGAVS